jgi:hypothetical protein
MKKIVTNSTLLALGAVLIAGLAAAAAGDAPFGVKATGEKVVLVSEGDGVETFALGDLRDGESRTLKGKNGTVTVTRKGDALEVQIDGEGGGEQHVTVTSGEGDESRILIRKVEGGDEPRVIVMRHATAKDGAVWTGEDGKAVEIEAVDGNAVFVGDGDGETGHIFVSGHGHGVHKIVALPADAAGFVWSDQHDQVLFRCQEDDTLTTGPKQKLDTLTPTCPVCGKPMQKLEGPKHKTVNVKVIKEESGDKPPQI